MTWFYFKEYINLTANYCQAQLKHNCAKTKFVSFRRRSSGPKWIVFWKYSKCEPFYCLEGGVLIVTSSWQACSDTMLLSNIPLLSCYLGEVDDWHLQLAKILPSKSLTSMLKGAGLPCFHGFCSIICANLIKLTKKSLSPAGRYSYRLLWTAETRLCLGKNAKQTL